METVWIHRLACALYKGRGGTLLLMADLNAARICFLLMKR